METHFSRTARATPLHRLQIELVVGSLLGDATLLATTRGYCFRVHHSIAQQALVDWKYTVMRPFVRTAPRRSGGGYYFRTVSHASFTVLRTLFYDENRKIVPFDLLNEYLTPFAMAVWIMDDGAADGRQLRLNTQGFTIEEARGLATLLERKFNVTASVNWDKGKPRLRINASGMNGLVQKVRPHMHPTMLYKLRTV